MDKSGLITETKDDQTIEPEGLRLWGIQTWLGIGLTLAFFAVLIFKVDWTETWEGIRKANKWLVLLAAVCHYSTYPVRGRRWRYTLARLHVGAKRGQFGLFVFFYNFVDNLIPGKLGDLYAAHLIKINLGVRRSAALGSIVFLRMIDAWFILCLALLSSFALFSSAMPDSVFWALIIGAVIAVGATLAMLATVLLHKALPHWVPLAMREHLKSFQSGIWPQRKRLPGIAFLTIVIWALEFCWMLFLGLAFGVEFTFVQLLFLSTIPLLASAFPLTPSGAGVVDVTIYGCLKAISVAHPVALSMTVLNRFIDYWLHIALGILVWAMRRKLGLRTWRSAPGTESEASTDQESPLEDSTAPGRALP